MFFSFVLLFVFGLWPESVTSEETLVRRYDGYKVYRVYPGTMKNISNVFVDMGLDVWKDAVHDDDVVVVMVSPDKESRFQQFLQLQHLSSQLFIRDVQKAIENEQQEQNHRTRRRTATLLDQISQRYLSYNEILNFVSAVKNSASKAADVEIINYGTSYEGRALRAVKISHGNTCKPAVLIDGGFHAREWISPATVLRFIHELAMNSANSDLVDKFDWYVVPVVNPDGYEYSRNKDRMWRKTRNMNKVKSCPGTDPNRNFDYHWDPYAGASTNPCSEVYAGPKPFSIPETTALANLMNAHKDRLKMYLTVHSYGQIFLYPYGYASNSRAPDHVELERMARIAVKAMKVYSYNVGSSGPDFGVAAGGSDDYAKGKMKIKYSYTIELPEHSFILSSSKISKVATDAWHGVRAMSLELSNQKYTNTLPCTPQPPPRQTTTPKPTTPKPATPKPATQHPCCVYMSKYKNYGGYYYLLKSCCELYG